MAGRLLPVLLPSEVLVRRGPGQHVAGGCTCQGMYLPGGWGAPYWWEGKPSRPLEPAPQIRGRIYLTNFNDA